jgi:Putative zinc-finger
MAVNDHALPPDAPPSDGSCPDEEEIAAFIDGTLPAGRRAAVAKHLASCESCSENYASALRFTVDEEERVSPQALQQHPFERADRRRQRWAVRSRAWRRGAVAAVAAVAAVLVASLGLLLVRGTGDISTEGMSADLLKSPAAMRKPWSDRVMRSGGPREEMPQDLADFRLGVRLLDLRLALADGDKGGAMMTLGHIDNVLHAMDFVPPESAKAFYRMREELDRGRPPAALLPEAAAEEKKLGDAGVEGEFVDLGRWTEACRIGAAARQEKIFHSRATRRLLDRAPALGADLPGGGEGPNQQAAEILSQIKTAASADPINFDALGTRCQDLLKLLDPED